MVFPVHVRHCYRAERRKFRETWQNQFLTRPNRHEGVDRRQQVEIHTAGIVRFPAAHRYEPVRARVGAVRRRVAAAAAVCRTAAAPTGRRQQDD